MDRITKALLDEFVSEHSLDALPEDRAFEHFSAYLLLSSHYGDSFETDDVVVGANADCGIDSIGVIVNGALVTEPEEVEDLATTNGYLDVVFVFAQSERSPNFESAKIGHFALGVRDFFSETPQLPQNERIRHYTRIMKEILNRSRLFKKGNPQCFLYYVTTGRWTDDANLVARRDVARQDVADIDIFRRVAFDCIDADRLQKLYRESQNAISREVTIPERTVIPDIPGVEQAYLALVPATEFLGLIETANNEIIPSLFYDNVRHWQDWTPVNTEIRDTLMDTAHHVQFPLLNNGITIVSRQLSLAGNRFLLEDYQIVNGCQTSYVLHECRAVLHPGIMVPVRLIATQNDDIKNAIIKATNRQTAVAEEQLLALSDFPKKLEAYFPTFTGRQKLYYERRSRQYNGMAGVEKVRVINMTTLVRAFASVFLAQPHRTTRNYKALLGTVGSEIFHKEHRLEPYYVSAYMHYRLEFLFRNEAMAADLKPARYHLLLAYRVLADSQSLPRMNSHEMERYCNRLMEGLWDDEVSKTLFEAAAEKVRLVAAGNLHRDNIRTEPFTSRLVAELGGHA